MRVVLDKRAPLSQSAIWRLQRAFFTQRGLAAWSDGVVPHYVTSHPRMAHAYVRMALGFVRAALASRRLTANQRVYVVELGAGSGRFAYRFLQKLRALQPARGPRITYVLTDISARSLDALQAHPALQPFAAAGDLDFAYFDVERPTDLYLRRAAICLAPGSLDTPLIAIANYVFDGVAQDCFAVHDGQLAECLLTTSVYPVEGSGTRLQPVERSGTRGGVPTDLDDPDLLGRVRLTYTKRPLRDANHYAEAGWNAILHTYARQLADAVFLFPTSALACLRFLRDLSADRLLVLTADKGVHLQRELSGGSYPRLTLHGSFSLPVNYHAIGEYVRGQSGQALEPRHQPGSLRICAYVWGITRNAFPELNTIYEDAVEQGGPDDFYTLKRTLEPYLDKLTLAQMLSYLRLSGWDSNVLVACELPMHARLAGASDAERTDLANALDEVWNLYLPIGEQEDLAFVIGTLLFSIERFDRALAYFERSRLIWGPYPATAYNSALCHKRLGAPDTALRLLDEALALDPDYGAAAEARRDLRS